MSSSNLNRPVLAVDADMQTIPENHTEKAAKRISGTALTAQAVVLVAFVGAIIWYLLWEASFRFLVRH